MDTSFPSKLQNAGGPEMADPLVNKAVRAGHETTDVSVRGLFAFTIGLFVLLVVILIGLVVLDKVFGFVDRRVDEHIERHEPGAASQVRLQPDYDGPLLQVKPEEDLRWMHDHNEMDLDGYGWVDRQAGVVRLPIDRAMDLLGKRGIPSVSPGHTLEELQRMRAQPQVYGQSLRP